MNTTQLFRFNLDSLSPMPLYMQLASAIREAVTDGRLSPGDVLPSERTLVDMLNISRGTARKALQLLLDERILVSHQGSGTFVSPHIHQSLPILESFSEMALASGGIGQSELVGYIRRAATQNECDILKLKEKNIEVIELTRLRKINGIKVSLQIAVLPSNLLDNIKELGDSLYLHLEKKDAPVLRASQNFKAVAVDQNLSHYLNVAENTPILLVTRIGFTHSDQPIEYTQTWCLNDYYDVTIELHKEYK